MFLIALVKKLLVLAAFLKNDPSEKFNPLKIFRSRLPCYVTVATICVTLTFHQTCTNVFFPTKDIQVKVTLLHDSCYYLCHINISYTTCSDSEMYFQKWKNYSCEPNSSFSFPSVWITKKTCCSNQNDILQSMIEIFEFSSIPQWRGCRIYLSAVFGKKRQKLGAGSVWGAGCTPCWKM